MRWYTFRLVILQSHYNPRTRTECDYYDSLCHLLQRITIHALTQSAIENGVVHPVPVTITIHALIRSAIATYVALAI